MHKIMPIQSAFSIKANLQAISYLFLKSLNIQNINSQLKAQQEQAPKFIKNAIVIIDFSFYAKRFTANEISQLIDLLKNYQIIPIGFANASIEQTKTMQSCTNLNLINNHKSSIKSENVTKPITKQVNGPIRSGQEVQNLQGDLIILGSVNPGSKVMAAGNVHIYGKLAGKVMAGAYGDKSAKIFVQQNFAELVSIAGIYQNAEHIKPTKNCSIIQLNAVNSIETISI